MFQKIIKKIIRRLNLLVPQEKYTDFMLEAAGPSRGVNIIVTTRNRKNFLKDCLDSLRENTTGAYQLFVIDDASDDGTGEYLLSLNFPQLKQVLLNKQCRGITFGFDALWNHSRFVDWFNGAPAKYLCYLQDDVVVAQKGWLDILVDAYEDLKDQYPIGFFSGHDAPEHPVEKEFLHKGRVIKLKKSIRATNMVAPRAFWDSMGLVPRLNPDGTPRGNPGPGPAGSNLDCYLTGYLSEGRPASDEIAAKQSSRAQKTLQMVVPGLLVHKAFRKEHSTWENENIEFQIRKATGEF